MAVRRLLGVLLVIVGVSATWAWGEVARLAAPPASTGQPLAAALIAAWQPGDAEQRTLFRSIDEGATWQPLDLPGNAAPLAWAVDGRHWLAVATSGDAVLRSSDGGDSWSIAVEGLPVSRLLWDEGGNLALGTRGHGIHLLAVDGTLSAMTSAHEELAGAVIVDLSLAGGRLFAATPGALFYSDDRGAVWTKTAVPERVTAMVALDSETVYVGTTTTGIYRSTDAGGTWQPAREGLGLAAGQMVMVTALRADPVEPGVLYAGVDYLVGGTHVHASAAGLFVTTDGGASWQTLAGPAFPEAEQASGLVLVPGKPLYAQAITTGGLQPYAPDVMRMLASLGSDDPELRASAARQLGLARPAGVWNELLARLDDPDPAVRLAASTALGRLDDPAAVPALLVAVEHLSEPVRLGAARALGLMGVEAAVDPLQAMLLHGGALEVSVAGEALGRIGGSEATDVLLVALADSRPTARWHAALAALETMGEPAVEPLLATLDYGDAQLRRNAAQALGWIGSETATQTLIDVLKADSDVAVRSQAAWALGEIGDPVARMALERAQLRDPAAEVHAAAQWALSRVPVQSEATPGWTTGFAAALTQLQPLRWLVLALSLAASAWLMMGRQSLASLPRRVQR